MLTHAACYVCACLILRRLRSVSMSRRGTARADVDYAAAFLPLMFFHASMLRCHAYELPYAAIFSRYF